MGTDLHARILAFDYGDGERCALMQEVWGGHPWVTTIFIGRHNEPREREMMEWCVSQFGQRASPLHKIEGRWMVGSAVVHGWMWVGFVDQADMEMFEARWPVPDGIKVSA